MRRAGAELAVPHTTVWRVLRKRLEFFPYRYQPLRKNFCVKFQEKLDVNGFENTLVFTDEATFHLCSKVNRHNLRFRGTENVNVTLELQRNSPKHTSSKNGINKLIIAILWRLPKITGEIYIITNYDVNGFFEKEHEVRAPRKTGNRSSQMVMVTNSCGGVVYGDSGATEGLPRRGAGAR
ncbi:uncharacterized protein TNCV_2269391 [Trichonephila clavipes]|nr:uncharacterized protein TNCV_2269391 [Trichonephila clavipes]